MQQFIGLVIAFVLLPVMIKLYPKVFKGKKASLGPILFVTGLIMAFIGGLPIGTMVSSFTKIFTTFSTLQTLIVVVEIGVLGSILKHYGILERIVRALEQLVPSKKALVMTLPAIMGMLPVPGGAFLSAPFVDSIGTDLQMKSDVKAAVNLYFRHFAMFILPYNTTMLAIASTLPQVNVYHVIAMNIPFVIVMLIGAFFAYVKASPSVKSQGGDKGKAFVDVLKYLSPIYMALVFNTLFGFDMYISIFLCILLTFFLIGKDKSEYIKSAVKGISADTFLMLIGVYFMQNIVKNLDFVMASVGEVLVGQSMVGFMLIVPVVGLAFGLSTGISLVPMGILLPFVAGMAVPAMTQTVYAVYILAWSFLGYYFSPFHLCQLLSIKYMGCDSKDVYKQHIKMAPVLAVAATALFFIYNMIFA
ncbi:MAG: DUF401 family protein [Clostridia bacterium]|nr:DUF401 family protein [Clostridia bacterium]MBQ3062942.1 DUF401 family protein [Clostridia bacterium]